jgi:hypothetical protein
LTNTRGTPPPPVRLFTYRLSGRIVDTEGKPVKGAVVITRTQDRDFWTFSTASDAQGRYSSFFSASDEVGANPVPLSVGVGLGGTNYGGVTGTVADFARLRSSTLDIQLGPGARYTLSKPKAIGGAVYRGVVVGVSGPRGVIKPLSARWPDGNGRFSLVLPSSARGKTLSVWEIERQVFTRVPARPGGRVSLTTWPKTLAPEAPRGLAFLAAKPR